MISTKKQNNIPSGHKIAAAETEAEAKAEAEAEAKAEVEAKAEAEAARGGKNGAEIRTTTSESNIIYIEVISVLIQIYIPQKSW